MSKKYFIRGAVWTILVIACLIVSYYAKVIFLDSISSDINKQLEKEKSIKNSIIAQETKWSRYNQVLIDNNKVDLMIPSEDSDEIIQQFYIFRPLDISGASLISFNMTDGMPSSLKLSKDVAGKKISLTMEVDNIDKFGNFIDELYNGLRCVYFGNYNYKLPGEAELSSDDYKIRITIEYYVFYVNK